MIDAAPRNSLRLSHRWLSNSWSASFKSVPGRLSSRVRLATGHTGGHGRWVRPSEAAREPNRSLCLISPGSCSPRSQIRLPRIFPELRKLIDRIESVTGIPRVALGHEVLRAPQLLQLPTADSIGVQLTLLLAFANAQAASLWTLDQDGTLKHVSHAGKGDLGALDTQRLARTLLTEESITHASDQSGSGILVDRGQQSRRRS